MKISMKLFAVFTLVVLSYMQKTNAQYATDPAFGINGITSTGFGGFGEQNGDEPYDMLIQPDGKIITAGISDGADGYFIAMARHLSDGTIDSDNFGDSGKVRIHFVARDQANAIALQADGKIVTVGSEATSNAGSAITQSIYRFDSDGSIDTTFGDHGFRALKYDGVSSGEFFGISIQTDGKILAAGSKNANAQGGSNGFGAMRFLPSGELDTTFGVFGKATISGPVLFNWVGCIFLPDGGIIMATYSFTNQAEYLMARMDSLGNRDTTFGEKGILQTGINLTGNTITKLLLTSDEKILLAGTTADMGTGQSQFSVFRFSLNGSIDSTFGTNGRTDIKLSNSDILHDVSIDANGKILLVGASASGFGFAGLARLNKDGDIDTTFAPGGIFISDLNNNTGTHYLTRAIPLSDGSILACGYNFGSGRGDFLLTKYVVNTTGVESNNIEKPNKYKLEQNYPNPFNPTTIIKYSILANVETRYASSVLLKVYDILGREVATLVNETQQRGNYEVTFNGSGLASGIYFYRLQAGNFVDTKKLILMK